MGTKTNWLHKVGRAAVTLTVLLALAQTMSCGRGGLFRRHRGESQGGPSAVVGTTSARPTAPRVRSLDDILREIDAYPTPKDVNAQMWSTLKAELKRLLIERATTSASGAGGPARQSTAGKSISIAPVGAPNAVTDLGASANPAGTRATLTWSEKLPGDYDNDGRVFIADLRPMALYYGEHTDSGPFDGHRLIVGDADPEIFITDLQAVADNYDASIQGYQVIRGTGSASAQTWETLVRPNPNPDPLHTGWSADRPTPPPVSCRPTYGYVDDLTGVADKAHVVYKVVPIGDGATGAESNVAVMSQSGLANSPWPKYHCDARNTGSSPFVGAQTNSIKWTFETGANIESSPVIGADGTVYVGCDDDNLYALDGGTGVIRWASLLDGKVKSSPAVAPDGTIYVSSYSGTVYALNPADGSKKWTHATGGSITGSPSIAADGTVYTGCDDGNLYALSPLDGSLRWSYAGGGRVDMCPAIGADGTIYIGVRDPAIFGTGGTVDAVRPDGTRKWRQPAWCSSIESPAVGADGYIVVTGEVSPMIESLSPTDGSARWGAGLGVLVASAPTIGPDGTAYVCDIVNGIGRLTAFRGGDGSVKWQWQSADLTSSSSPSCGADGTLFVGGRENFYSLDPSNGSVKWSCPTKEPVNTSPAIGADGTVYAASAGAIYAFGTPMPNTHSVSGTITVSGGGPLPGVLVSLTPRARASYSNADGTFSLTGVPDGVYTLQPVLNGYSFAPSNRLVVVSGADLVGQDFVATQGAGSISGTVATATQAGVGGVTLTLTPGGRTAVTNVDGTYRFDSVVAGNYTVTPLKPWYSFIPPSRPVTVVTSQTVGASFIAVPAATGHIVSGIVTQAAGGGLAGVAMVLTPGNQNATTQADGTFSITDVADGTYTLSPVKARYAFTPPNRQVVVSGADVTGQDFTGVSTDHSVSGRVTDASGVTGMADVAVTLTPGGLNSTTQTDGTYAITGVQDGSYTATPSKQWWGFTPPNRQVVVSGADVTGVDFAAFSAYSVSGRVTDSMGFGVQSVTMTLTPGGLKATTLADGTYTILAVANGSYTLTPSRLDYAFTPTNRAVTIGGADVTGQDFAVVGGLANSAWPKYGHDARNTCQSPYVGAQTNEVKWHYMAESPASAPVIGEDGTVYTGSGRDQTSSGTRALLAVNPADGSIRWALEVDYYGLHPSAIGSGGTVYAANAGGGVYAINAADGTEKWRVFISGTPAPPSVGPDGTIYIGTSENYGTHGKLYALSPLDGSVKWFADLGDAVTDSLAIGPDGTIYAAGGHSVSGPGGYALHAVNPDGTQKWTAAAQNASGPSVGTDGTVYKANGGEINAFNPADGTVLWQSAIIGAYSAPAIGADGTLYVGTIYYGGVYALRQTDGSIEWHASPGGTVSSPLAVGADQTVYVGVTNGAPLNDGDVYALNGADGAVKWEYSALAGMGCPAIGADGTVYVDSSDGRLYAFGTGGPRHSISGTITDSTSGAGLEGATVTLIPGNQTATSQADGSYVLTGVPNGTYVLTPTHPTHWMDPSHGTQTVLNADVTGPDFVAFPGGLADSPWPKFHRDAANTGQSPYAGIQVKSLKWTFQTGNQVESSPVIGADGTIYVGSSDQKLYALNPDGGLMWSRPVSGGIYTAPAVGATGTVYVQTWIEAYFINATDGTVKWGANCNGQPWSPSIGPDGTVYFVANGYDYGLLALNQADGSDRWILPNYYDSSPAIGPDGTLYLGTKGGYPSYDFSVCAANPLDGSVKWKYHTGATVASAPVIGTDGTVYFCTSDGVLYAFDSGVGSLKWSYSFGADLDGSPAIGPSGTIYVGCSNGKLYSINPADGSIIDTFPTGGAIYSSPAVGALETVYFGSDDGYVYAVNAVAHPKIPMWMYKTGGAVRSSPAIGADGTVYIGSNDGKLYAFGM